MTAKIKAAILSALIGLGAFAFAPASAQAEGLYLNYGSGSVGMHDGDYRHVDYRHGRRYDRRCTPDRAVEKAERHGLRRVRVVDVDRRTITVAGRKWDRRVHMTFSRAPHCPIIRG